MARIRTFKPEFFRSPDTAKASPRARLLYMAMWSWADDEGVGETNIYGLLGFAFPDSDNLTVEDLQSLLKEIRGSYGVLFYECRGRFYYAIPSWDSHQKTERRAKARFPKPDDPEAVPDLRFGTSEDLRGNSLQTEGRSPLGTGEQGNRGTDMLPGGGLGSEAATSGADLVRRIIPREHPDAVKTALRIKASELINTGTPPDTVAAALKLWLTKPNLGPNTLPALVSEVIRRNTPTHGLSTGEAKVLAWAELGNTPTREDRKELES